jgi:hypothetical protein
MKSNKGRKKLSSEIATPEKLPLELVAATALHFQAEMRNWHPQLGRNAVECAILFLKICAERIEATQRSDPLREDYLKEYERRGWKEDDIIPYNEGIKFITGQKRLDRAQAYYKDYVNNFWQLENPAILPEVAAHIKSYKEKGFVARFLYLRRYEFDFMRASGRLHLSRRKKIQKKT